MVSPRESGPPRLFDRALRGRRIARGLERFDGPGFLLEKAAELAADKLGDVTRVFERALVWGDRGRHLTGHLMPGKIGTIVHADLSPVAGGIAADAEASPFANGIFDLVVSLLDLHAANDPVGLLVQAGHALKADGLFIGVMFGAETLNELRGVLAEAEIATVGGLSPRIFPYADVRDAGGLLQRAGFALPVADMERVTVRYRETMQLFADLRSAGETNVLTERRRRFLRRDTLAKGLAQYTAQADAEGRIAASFVFVTLTGWTPHASQQKPLRPGSGEISLADVLKEGGQASR